MKVIANNKKAFFQYFILEKIEAGIQLFGDEVKSLRHAKASINEAYAEVKKGEMFLVNADIAKYEKSSNLNRSDAKRTRKLLISKKDIVMKLHTLKPAEGSTRSGKRIARGQGSGRGGTSTRGHKGAQSRSGY